MPLGVDVMNPSYAGASQYPGLAQAIVQVAMAPVMTRFAFGTYPMPGKSAESFTKEGGARRTVVSRVAEGAEIRFDDIPYTNIVGVPYKIGQGLLIPTELYEDQQLPLVMNQTERQARVVGQTMEVDAILSLLSNATLTWATTGKSPATSTGAATTLANTVGLYDLLNAKAVLGHYNFYPDSLYMNSNVEAQIRNLPGFHVNEFFGTSVLMGGEWPGSNGMESIGKILGWDCFVSSLFIDTPTASSGNNRLAVVARGSRNPLRLYSPLGYYLDKRPVTAERERKAARDAEAYYLTSRYQYVVLNNLTYAVLTGCGAFTEGTAPLA